MIGAVAALGVLAFLVVILGPLLSRTLEDFGLGVG